MQTMRSKASTPGVPRPGARDRARDLLPLFAGAAVAVGGVGAMLALVDLDSPLRGPFTLFFLIAAPGAAIAAALRALEPWGRAVAAVAGSIAVNMLVAQAMLALHVWSVRGGVVAVTVLSALVLLLLEAQRLRRHAVRKWTS
ncbi:hypothetical protein [Streptomyces alfalfae]|uniref:Uncharacterized protein n=1 Tax=Streptomyces alfalfae TaxID=1642299 RepID=A0ABN4VV56_9ACTN|nr:hypothetical protein [Streptomyces alfalfae]APY89090.1 hypothetical protein A7J05_28365 [Streptomyces alfalfae]